MFWESSFFFLSRFNCMKLHFFSLYSGIQACLMSRWWMCPFTKPWSPKRWRSNHSAAERAEEKNASYALKSRSYPESTSVLENSSRLLCAVLLSSMFSGLWSSCLIFLEYSKLIHTRIEMATSICNLCKAVKQINLCYNVNTKYVS